MRAAATLALGLLACGGAPEPVAPPAVAVRAWLDGAPTEAGGTLVIQTTYDPTGQVELPTPEVKGLEFREHESRSERIGDREVVTHRFGFSGRKGSYEIGSLVATWRGEAGEVEATGSPVFVDLGVAAPREAEPEDIVEPEPIRVIPWAAVGGIGLGAAVLGAGLYVAFGATRRRPVAAAPPERPDVVALRAWTVVRADPALSDHDKALQLSRIFREYTEEVLKFPATAWTTTETVDHLAAMRHLPEGNVPRAKRLLRATDRVKFAEHQPGVDFFEELDADLRAFVGTTAPRTWQEAG